MFTQIPRPNLYNIDFPAAHTSCISGWGYTYITHATTSSFIMYSSIATWSIQSQTVQEPLQDWHGREKDPHCIRVLCSPGSHCLAGIFNDNS